MRLRGKTIFLFLFLALILPSFALPASAQDDEVALEYSLNRIELHIRINADGTLDVVETQTVSVDQGNLFSGFQNLSLRQLDGVENMSVEADGRLLNLDDSACAFCYWTVIQPRQPDWVFVDETTYDLVFNPDSMGQVQTFWDFPGISEGETANFVLRYKAIGAIQIFEDSQRFIWDVTPGFEVPVDEATMFITPPPNLAPEDLIVEAGEVDSEIDEFGRIALTYNGAVPADTHWFVNVALPAAATNATIPDWQEELDRVVAAAESAQARGRNAEQTLYVQQSRQQFVALGFTILILVAASILIVRQRRGPEEASFPFADLPAAAVPFLAEGEDREQHSLLAQLITLVDYGLVQIEGQPTESVQLVRPEKGLRERARWTLPSGQEIKLPPAVVNMYGALPAGSTPLPAAIEALSGKLDAIVEDMLADASEAMDQLPEQRHERWHKASIGLVAVGLVALVGTAVSGIGRLGWIAFAPGLALLLAGGLIYYQNRQVAPRNPDLAKLSRQYRQTLKGLRNKQEPTRLNHHLHETAAYAVALGEVDSLLQAAEKAGSTPPAWLTHFASLQAAMNEIKGVSSQLAKLADGYKEMVNNSWK